MTYTIKIDRSTIRKNSNFGEQSEPKYLFGYDWTTTITCSLCDRSFPASELRYIEDSADENPPSTTGCPKCGAPDCVELEFEKLNLTKEK